MGRRTKCQRMGLRSKEEALATPGPRRERPAIEAGAMS